MASQSTLSDRGESVGNVGDSQPSSGIRNASAEAYTSSATLASSYGNDSAGSYLPNVQVTDSAQNTSSSGGNQSADQQTLQDFQSSNNSFSNLTSDYSTAIQDLSSGSSNSVADLANLYGAMTQANGQLLNAQNEQGSIYTNDSQLQNQLTGSDSVQGDVSNDQGQIMSALMSAANGNDSSALSTLTNDFGHFSTDTQQDVSSIGSLAQNDYNAAYLNDNSNPGGESGANGGGGCDTTSGTTTGGGGSDTTSGTTTGGGGSDTTSGTTTGGGGSDTTSGTTTAGGDATAGGATSTSSDTLPSFLNDGLNDQQQAGLNEMNGGNHQLEARAEGHMTNGYDEGQTALQMLENGGSTAQISTAINEAATNVRDGRASLYTSLTGNGLVRHPVNPDDPINEGLNQYPAANQEFKLAQESLQAGDRTAAEEAVTAALTDMSNGNDSVLGGLGEQLGVSS